MSTSPKKKRERELIAARKPSVSQAPSHSHSGWRLILYQLIYYILKWSDRTPLSHLVLQLLILSTFAVENCVTAGQWIVFLANQSGKEKAKYTRLRYRYLQFRALVCSMTWRFEIKDSRYYSALHLTSKVLCHGEFHWL